MCPGYVFRNIAPITAAEQYTGDSPTKSIPYSDRWNWNTWCSSYRFSNVELQVKPIQPKTLQSNNQDNLLNQVIDHIHMSIRRAP
jgi:hypothetical protein